eukprot:scaffold33557_cov27-Tisochrysis_lutea.AAC.2
MPRTNRPAGGASGHLVQSAREEECEQLSASNGCGCPSSTNPSSQPEPPGSVSVIEWQEREPGAMLAAGGRSKRGRERREAELARADPLPRGGASPPRLSLDPYLY